MKSTRLTGDINPFGLRMQDDLKEALIREARFNGRSLNAEIVDRLRKSIEPPIRTEGGLQIAETPSSYTPEINDIERKLLTVFRRLPPEKQLALLSLFN